MEIDLNSITKTKIATDISQGNVLIYGKPKVGKTTFITNVPNYLLAATEKGYNYLEVIKQDITCWQDFLKLALALSTQEHKYKTLVVDTADWLYKYCEQYTMTKHKVEHPSDLGYGKGFALVRDEFTRVINKVNMNGMNFIFTSHAKEKTEKTKTGEWTVMGTSLGGTAETFIAGLCDIVLYFYISDDGQRLMRTKPTKYILAGDRSKALPEIMPIDFMLLSDYLNGKKKISKEEVAKAEVKAKELEQEAKQEGVKITDISKLKNYALDAIEKQKGVSI